MVAGLALAADEVAYAVVRIVQRAGAEGRQVVIARLALRQQRVEIQYLRFQHHAEPAVVILGDRHQRVVDQLFGHQQRQLQLFTVFLPDAVRPRLPTGLVQQLFGLIEIVSVRIDAVRVIGPGDRRNRLVGDFAVTLIHHGDQLLPIQAVNQRLAHPLVLQRRTLEVEVDAAVIA